MLKEKSISLSYIEKLNGKTSLVYELNPNISLNVTIKKHFLKDIRINTSKYIENAIDDLDFISRGVGNWLHVINEDKYNEFIKDYKTLDLSNNNLINLINTNNLDISFSSHLSIDDITGKISFKTLDLIKSNDDRDIILLNNNTINIILNLLDFINKN